MKNYFYIFFCFLLTACEGLIPADLPSLVKNSGCAEGVLTDGTGCKITKDTYVYSTQYGGRSALGANYTAANSVSSFSIPAGWYDGSKAISAVDANLISTNISAPNVIFGVAVVLTGATFPNCNTSGALNAAACTVLANNFVYASDKGGRSANCSITTDPQTLSSDCWLSATSKYLYTGSTAVDCSVEGILSPHCNIPVGGFWYTTAYNGRGTVCSNVNSVS